MNWRSILLACSLFAIVPVAYNQDGAPPPLEWRTAVPQWIERWERETETAVDPRMIDDAVGSLAAFWGSFCTDGQRCTNLFSTSDSAYKVLKAYLEENSRTDPIVSTLLERYAQAVGMNSGKIGFSSEESRGLARVDFERQPELILQVKGRGVVTVRRPVKRVLLRAGDYVVANGAWGLAIKVSETNGQMVAETNATDGSVVSASPSRVGLPWQYICPEFRSSSVGSKPVYGPGRDGPNNAPAAFYLSKQLTVSIVDHDVCRGEACREALHRNILDALSFWRSACAQCPDDFIGAVSIDGKWYAAEAYVRTGSKGPTAKALRRPAEIYVPVDSLPQSLRNTRGGAGVSIRITLGARPEACEGGIDVIGCATVDKGIEINAEDYTLMDGDSKQFGTGSRQVETAIVFLHEIGHWFGVPHSDALLTPAEDRFGLMEAGYRGQGQCMSNGDATLLEEVSDTSSKFRLKACNGFLYRVGDQRAKQHRSVEPARPSVDQIIQSR